METGRSRMFFCVVSLLFIVLVAGLMGACTKPVPAPSPANPASTSTPVKTIELKFAGESPVTDRSSMVIINSLPSLERATEGRVKIKFYPGGSLLALPEMLEGTQKGICDIAYLHSGFFSLKNHPYVMLGGLPFIYEDRDGFWRAWSTDDRLQKLEEEYLWEEGFDNVKISRGVVYSSMSGWAFRGGTQKLEPKTPEDFKALKIRVSGWAVDLFKEYYGVMPVSVPAAEIYESLERGIIDGTQANNMTWLGWRIHDVAKWYFKHDFNPTSIVWVVNKNSLERLSQDDQVAVMDYLEDLSWRFSADAFASEYSLDSILMRAGCTKYEASSEEKAMWNAPANDFIKSWMDACGDWARRGLSVIKEYNPNSGVDWSALGL